MRYSILLAAALSLVSAAAFADACPVNPATITCTQGAVKNDPGSKGSILNIERQGDGTYDVGKAGVSAGTVQSKEGSTTLVVKTSDYTLDDVGCHLFKSNEKGAMVTLDCTDMTNVTGSYSFFDSQNAIEDGSPCDTGSIPLSACTFTAAPTAPAAN